jgi:hypothetical protein
MQTFIFVLLVTIFHDVKLEILRLRVIREFHIAMYSDFVCNSSGLLSSLTDFTPLTLSKKIEKRSKSQDFL